MASERGSVAILVLWGMVLVFVLLAAAGVTTRSEALIAANAVAAARVRAAAEAGTQLGLYRLLRRRAAGRMLFDGAPETWHDGTATVSIAIADEAGKIDLNQAPIELLQGLFVAVGRSRDEAMLIACNILDRRGGSGPGCPEPDDSAPPTPPRPFAAPEELAQIPGVGPDLYAAVADDVTVASGASAVDPQVAPREVLLAIPGATPDLVDSYLADRSRWRDLGFGADSADMMLPAERYLTRSPARDFTITAVAAAAGARFRAQWQVRLTGVEQPPYRIVAWRTP
jgi:general secretion pathway protein K